MSPELNTTDLQQQAEKMAKEIVIRANKTMSLEDQKISEKRIKNSIKEGFYVANSKNSVEITFYQAVKLFEATKKEKPTEVFENHFDAVNCAIEQFKKAYNNVFSVEEFDVSNLSVQERNSVLFLNSLKDMQRNFPGELSDEFVEMINASLRIIYMGVFRKFRLEISTLAAKQKKKKMKLEKVISELNQIMNNYPISNIARLDAMRTEEEKKPKAFEEPKIVITETFA